MLEQHFENTPRIHLYPDDPLKKCFVCDSDMQELYRSKSRIIRYLDGNREVIDHIMVCKNELCNQFMMKVYPRRITPPHSSFHFEVIARVGMLRKKENRTFEEILQHLKQTDLEIGNSRSCVRHLMDYFEIYDLLWEEEALNNFCQGQDVVISIDGAKPAKGSEVLYTINEVYTKRPLISKFTLYSDTQTMEDLFQEVASLNLNIVGIVSDKQRTFQLGAQKVFGDIPHQLCQYHWLKQAGSPLYEKNSSLNTQLKKLASKIRYMTTKVKNEVLDKPVLKESFSVLEKLAPYLTVILTAKSKPPFRLVSLQTWKYLSGILSQLLQLLEVVGSNLFKLSIQKQPANIKRLVQVVRFLSEGLESSIWDSYEVEWGLNKVREVDSLIDPSQMPRNWIDKEKKEALALVRLELYINTIQSQPNAFQCQFQENLQDSFLKWKNNLLICFDFPQIPRTSNLHEQSIKTIKHPFRKLLGHSSIHQVLRAQQNFLPVELQPTDIEFVVFSTLVSRDKYKLAFLRYWSRRELLKKEYRIKRDFLYNLTTDFQELKEEMKIS